MAVDISTGVRPQVSGLKYEVSGLRSQISDLGSRISDLGSGSGMPGLWRLAFGSLL